LPRDRERERELREERVRPLDDVEPERRGQQHRADHHHRGRRFGLEQHPDEEQREQPREPPRSAEHERDEPRPVLGGLGRGGTAVDDQAEPGELAHDRVARDRARAAHIRASWFRHARTAFISRWPLADELTMSHAASVKNVPRSSSDAYRAIAVELSTIAPDATAASGNTSTRSRS